MSIKQAQTPNEVLEIEDFNNPGHYIDRSTWLVPNSCATDVGQINTTTFGTNGWTSGIPGKKTVTIEISAISSPEFRSFSLAALDQTFGVRFYPQGKVYGGRSWSFSAMLSKNMVIQAGEITEVKL